MAVYALQTPGLVRVCPGRPGRRGHGSTRRVMGRPGLAGFLHLPVFLLTRTGPVTGSTYSRVDPPGRTGFNNYVINSLIGRCYCFSHFCLNHFQT
ncbi:hypothetical protein Peur_004186 [Populus x canadensis]